MKQQYRFVLVIALLLLAVLPMTAQEESGPPPVGLRPDAPTYAMHGPYWVGTTELVIEDEERPIPVTMWYPALNPENEEEFVAYTPIIKWVPWPEGDYTIYGRALLNAAPDVSDAPYPLVVFSHGNGVFPARHAYIPEHLASFGFVVIAPDHAEHWYLEADTFRELLTAEVDRPHDIVKTLDYAEGLTGPNGVFEALIDMEQVAVMGHSFGGWTALVAGGARFDLKAYDVLCNESGSTPGLTDMMLCDTPVPNEEAEVELARLAGLDSVPEGLWPSMGDPRVKAIIPMAGDAYQFGEAGLAEVKVPMMAMGGTMDTMSWFDWGSRLAYDLVGSPQKSLVGFEYAEHSLFNTQCSDELWMLDFDASYFCSDPVWDMNRAHDLINHFSTAFLLDVLKGDAEAHTALLAENVSFPGITYETTLK